MRTDPRVFRDLRPGNGLHNSLTGSRPGVEVGVKTKFKKKKNYMVDSKQRLHQNKVDVGEYVLGVAVAGSPL